MSFPYKQVTLLVLANAIVVAAFYVVYPFLNQTIVELGAERPSSVGYYSGLLESGLALAGFVTSIPCSYASDVLGRKPVVLISMVGTMISMYFWSISTTFFELFISRCIGGGFGPNWTWTVSLVIMGEITDVDNAAFAYSALNVGHSMGTVIGPFIGGLLVRPSTHYDMFETEYWGNNPYKLPCFTGIFLLGVTTLIVMIYMEETLPSTASSLERPAYSTLGTNTDITENLEPSRDELNSTTSKISGRRERMVTVWDVITPTTIPVLITSFAWSLIAASLFTVHPLWAFTPIDEGGLGASETAIGLQMSLRGLLNTFVMFLYPIAEKRIGLYKLYAWSMVMWVLSGLGYPALNYMARVNGSIHGIAFQVLTLFWITIWSFAAFVWIGNPQMINRVAPSKAALARIMSVANICTLLGGTVGPMFANSLFEWSISLDFASGNLVWIVMFIAASLSASHAFSLREPSTDWRAQTEEQIELNITHTGGDGDE